MNDFCRISIFGKPVIAGLESINKTLRLSINESKFREINSYCCQIGFSFADKHIRDASCQKSKKVPKENPCQPKASKRCGSSGIGLYPIHCAAVQWIDVMNISDRWLTSWCSVMFLIVINFYLIEFG